MEYANWLFCEQRRLFLFDCLPCLRWFSRRLPDWVEAVQVSRVSDVPLLFAIRGPATSVVVHVSQINRNSGFTMNVGSNALTLS